MIADRSFDDDGELFYPSLDPTRVGIVSSTVSATAAGSPARRRRTRTGSSGSAGRLRNATAHRAGWLPALVVTVAIIAEAGHPASAYVEWPASQPR
jgi:hypothetical protein